MIEKHHAYLFSIPSRSNSPSSSSHRLHSVTTPMLGHGRAGSPRCRMKVIERRLNARSASAPLPRFSGDRGRG